MGATRIVQKLPDEHCYGAPTGHDYCNATCFSLFPDAGMADLLGALDSRNDGEQKSISR
jgi:hypothetical protein